MPEWHQLDSSSIMPQQQESTKKKTLKSSSRSFWFSTGLVCTLIKHSVTKFSVISLNFSKKYFPKVRIFMRIMILWYYQIRPKVVWEVHGAWIDGYFLSIILASLRLSITPDTIPRTKTNHYHYKNKTLLFFRAVYHSKNIVIPYCFIAGILNILQR